MVGTCIFATQMLECQPKVEIGNWACSQQVKSSSSGSAGAAGSGAAGDALAFPWSTDFEDGFCGYQSDGGGFCYPKQGDFEVTGTTQWKLVTEPVHSSNYAAAFIVDSEVSNQNTQSRCVRQGTFPVEAYYGAWYYIPTNPKEFTLWDLFHFRGGDSVDNTTIRLWDVQLDKKDNGDLRLKLHNFDRGDLPDQSDNPSIPIGEWFHIVLHVKRPSAEDTGVFTLYQDGAPIYRVPDQKADTTKVQQWFVGNLAENMDPVESMVYVDDVTLNSSL